MNYNIACHIIMLKTIMVRCEIKVYISSETPLDFFRCPFSFFSLYWHSTQNINFVGAQYVEKYIFKK